MIGPLRIVHIIGNGIPQGGIHLGIGILDLVGIDRDLAIEFLASEVKT